ncbi:MAG: GIY-YIG nuclease family protein [Alphaproteobacteria bacterium]|nr:GIY-YIG nuclease family protein [Alphaproteobacteria bacterium]
MSKSGGYVYILSNKKNGVLYIGSTSDLIGRIYEHKNKIIPNSFSAKYNLEKLVYFEWHDTLKDMVLRERQMKEWHRKWKIHAIESMNPDWEDLYNNLLIDNGYSPGKD